MSRRTKISMLGTVAVASAALASPAAAVVNTFSFDTPAPGTLGDSGLTTVLPGSDLALERVSLGGGALSVTTSEGDAWRLFNDQENALAVPVANGPATFTVRTTILLPPAPSVAFQSAGIVVGVDEDNYVKAVLSSRSGSGALNFVHEQNGTPVVDTDATRFSLNGVASVTISMTVEASGRVTPQFQVNGGAPQPIASPGFIDDPQFAGSGVTAGIITTDFDNRNAVPPAPSTAPSLTFRFDEFVLDNPNQTGALPAPPPPPLTAGAACAVGPDTTAPQLTVSPSSGAKVSRTPAFVITANEPVLVPRSAARLVDGDGRTVASRVRLAADSRQIRIVPTVPLDPQTGLSLIISGGNDRDAVADVSCNRTGSPTRSVYEVPTATAKPGAVSVAQLRINQRISQAALLREKAIRERLDGDLVGADLQSGSFGRSPFGAGVTLSGTDSGLLTPSAGGRVLDLGKLSRSSGKLELSAGQLLINQRISQAAVRRVNALQARLDAGLRGSDLAAGAVSAAKLSRGLSFTAITAVPPAAAPSAPSGPSAPRGGSTAGVKLTAGQLLINQRISQAAVRRLNAIRGRMDLGLVGEDFQAGTVTGSRASN